MVTGARLTGVVRGPCRNWRPRGLSSATQNFQRRGASLMRAALFSSPTPRSPPMSNDRIKELIERLEKAPGPSRELDRLIEETLPGVERHMYEDMFKDGYVISGHGHSTYPP